MKDKEQENYYKEKLKMPKHVKPDGHDIEYSDELADTEDLKAKERSIASHKRQKNQQ
ncbi:YfhD family protein [Priestia endophytica]|mgnify:CR=1 FL=1|jgi:YfhD-like protein|uniref:Uncharacterized protein n=3 Tax=Bacillaceae TaxID=186817 RepID=A0A329EN36_9BACI|nr:YfhD family protein [Priestia endophytica]KAB2492515.1 YfhD family protein [Priestia endophytica]MCM3540501.1 YfhD family protein [Priestia endophytica]MED4071722.1 YfhD family protein [Priestia endophytica]RAS78558.1 hypothetical protein A4R27_16835 [Priestia endophytica]RAS80812.1 hypothetical protein A3864_03530 [Priestia endophytica]